MKRSVVAICGDPGGANAVAPVLKLLAREGRVSVRALGYNEACALWAGQGIVLEPLPPDIGRPAMIDVLNRPATGLLLTGTSVNSLELEKRFIAASRDVGLPSLSVLDFWSNYRRRFADASGALVYLTDRVAIMDEETRREMSSEGIDPGILEVTGQPAFDDLADFRQEFTTERRDGVRAELGAGRDDLVVLFASQPLAQVFGSDVSNPDYLGYDERQVASVLISALKSIATRSTRPIRLVFRPHPRETPEVFTAHKNKGLDVTVAATCSSRDLLMSADLVTGMNTNLLVEACYLGCIVVSLQPGLGKRDVLPTNRLGFSHPVYAEAEIEPTIERMLLDNEIRAKTKTRLAEFECGGGAAGRVVELVYRMIGG